MQIRNSVTHIAIIYTTVSLVQLNTNRGFVLSILFAAIMVNDATAIPWTADGSSYCGVIPKLFSELPVAQVTLGAGVGDLERPSLNPQRSHWLQCRRCRNSSPHMRKLFLEKVPWTNISIYWNLLSCWHASMIITVTSHKLTFSSLTLRLWLNGLCTLHY